MAKRAVLLVAEEVCVFDAHDRSVMEALRCVGRCAGLDAFARLGCGGGLVCHSRSAVLDQVLAPPRTASADHEASAAAALPRAVLYSERPQLGAELSQPPSPLATPPKL